MPIQLQLRLPPSAEPTLERDRERLITEAARVGHMELSSVAEIRIDKVSFDARRRHRDWQVRVSVFEPGEELPDSPATEPPVIEPPAGDAAHVVIVGAGPAGMFCAYDLAIAGVRVTLLERGGDVRARRRPLARIHRGQGVDPDSNYCFGEGGAGTYSDGKLYTRSGNKRLVRGVLETLVAHGAQPSILSSWRPHVGSNKLPDVVAAMRETLRCAGVDVRFHSRVEELLVERRAQGQSRVTGVKLRQLERPDSELETIAADAVVLAAGHSARDTLEMAQRAGAGLEAKGFALGVRAEHPQPWLDEHQYGGLRAECELPPAFYELVAQVEQRGVYSFCMCPGGWVMPATTADDRVVVNGMSLSRRDSPFANSGIVVQLEPEDWCGQRARDNGLAELTDGAPDAPADDPLFGVRVQEALERRAARAGGGRSRVPSQSIADFIAGRASVKALPTSYQAGVTPIDMHALLPRGIASRLREGLLEFDGRIDGFAGEHGQLLAPESRTSSPVRLMRDRETLEAAAAAGGVLEGLFPCGEGAGYSGGIVSAALDGRRIAAALTVRHG